MTASINMIVFEFRGMDPQVLDNLSAHDVAVQAVLALACEAGAVPDRDWTDAEDLGIVVDTALEWWFQGGGDRILDTLPGAVRAIARGATAEAVVAHAVSVGEALQAVRDGRS